MTEYLNLGYSVLNSIKKQISDEIFENLYNDNPEDELYNSTINIKPTYVDKKWKKLVKKIIAKNKEGNRRSLSLFS